MNRKTITATIATLALVLPGAAAAETSTSSLVRLAPKGRVSLVCETAPARVLHVRERPSGRVMPGRSVAFGSGIVWRLGRARVTLDRHSGLVVNHTARRVALRWVC